MANVIKDTRLIEAVSREIKDRSNRAAPGDIVVSGGVPLGFRVMGHNEYEVILETTTDLIARMNYQFADRLGYVAVEPNSRLGVKITPGGHVSMMVDEYDSRSRHVMVYPAVDGTVYGNEEQLYRQINASIQRKGKRPEVDPSKLPKLAKGLDMSVKELESLYQQGGMIEGTRVLVKLLVKRAKNDKRGIRNTDIYDCDLRSLDTDVGQALFLQVHPEE